MSRTLSDRAAVRLDETARVAVVEFGAPPANLLDRATVAALDAALDEVAARSDLGGVVLRGRGDHFSYGASVQEHLPGELEAMLPEFHALLRRIGDPKLPPVLALVGGRCLGGGLELALACDLVAVTPGAELGCPEVRLGVFPPAAAALLPLRLGAGEALRMVVHGHVVDAAVARRSGLAELEFTGHDPEAEAAAWLAERHRPLSAAALRQARHAARWPWREALGTRLEALERQYLDELMATEDAHEGLTAFLERRLPTWKHR